MKKIITLLTAVLFAGVSFAQVLLPYSQDFENVTFMTGGGIGLPGVQFIPGWYGNQVQPTPASWRIHRDTIHPNLTGRVCLAALPTATVRDTIILSMTVPAYTQANINFYTASDSAHANGPGTRSAKVNYDFSFDGGFGYTQKVALGDTSGFPRTPTPYTLQSILVPYSTTTIATNYSLKFRLVVSRGYGVGTAARFLMDDFDVTLSPVTSVENRIVKSKELVVFPNPSRDVVSFRVSDNAIHNGLLRICDIAGRVIYTKTAFDLAQNQLFTLPDALQAGNYMVTIQTDDSIYTQKLLVE